MKIYTDDLEVIGIMRGMPKFYNFPPHQDMLKFMEEETFGQDFGTGFEFKGQYYVLYKYGNIEDPGLILLTSDNIDELIEYVQYKPEVFPNQEIRDAIFSSLHGVKSIKELQKKMPEEEFHDMIFEMFDNIGKLDKREFDKLPEPMKQAYFANKPIIDEVKRKKSEGEI